MVSHDQTNGGRNAGIGERRIWILYRDPGIAVCTLGRRPNGWELRVIIDNMSLLIEMCDRLDQVVAIADRWKSRLQASGWQEVKAAARV